MGHIGDESVYGWLSQFFFHVILNSPYDFNIALRGKASPFSMLLMALSEEFSDINYKSLV